MSQFRQTLQARELSSPPSSLSREGPSWASTISGKIPKLRLTRALAIVLIGASHPDRRNDAHPEKACMLISSFYGDAFDGQFALRLKESARVLGFACDLYKWTKGRTEA